MTCSCCDSRNVEEQSSRVGIIRRLEHTRNRLVGVTSTLHSVVVSKSPIPTSSHSSDIYNTSPHARTDPQGVDESSSEEDDADDLTSATALPAAETGTTSTSAATPAAAADNCCEVCLIGQRDGVTLVRAATLVSALLVSTELSVWAPATDLSRACVYKNNNAVATIMNSVTYIHTFIIEWQHKNAGFKNIMLNQYHNKTRYDTIRYDRRD